MRFIAVSMPPARRMWLSLMRIPSSRPKRWFVPPPVRTAYFSSARSVGVVLRVSRIVMRPPAASTKRLRERRDARQPLEEVQRRPLGRQHRPCVAPHFRDDVAWLAEGSVRLLDREHDARIELAERFGGDVHAGDHAVAFGDDDAAGALRRSTVASVVMSRSPRSSSSARCSASR